MELEQFSILESKIHRLVEIVEALTAENRNLKTNIGDLQSTISIQEKQIFELEKQLADEKEKHHDSNNFKEREDMIRKKIEQILEKLENLEFEL